VTSPIVAIVLVLCAVFIPIAFLGGLTGELYRQFAVTISIAVVLSGIVALTLTPALTVLILKREHKQEPGRFFSWFNRTFARTTDRYENGVAWMVRRGAVATVLFLLMVFATVMLWRSTPGSLVPEEDQGFYIAMVILPDGSSLERTDQMVQKVVATVKENPNIENAVAFTGMDFIGGGVFRNNAATIFVTFKHWDERKVAAQQLVGEFFGRTGGFKEGLAIAFNAPAIFALGATGGFEMHLQNRGEGGPRRLAEVSQMFIGRAMQEPGIAQAQMFWRPNVPQLFVDVDREKAKSLGVPIDEVFNALAATLGTYYVNDFNKYGRTVAGADVIRGAIPQATRRRGRDLRAQRQGRDGSGRAHLRGSSTPAARTRWSASTTCPAVTVLGSGGPGVSTGQALEKIEKVAKEVLPRTSASTGAAPRCRRRSPAARRSSRSRRAPSWRSSSSRRSTSAGGCRYRSCSRCPSGLSARSPRSGSTTWCSRRCCTRRRSPTTCTSRSAWSRCWDWPPRTRS
jgi:HAE1 family hydrophobic/amphiphilic exporter-1/multidrug efflux pump